MAECARPCQARPAASTQVRRFPRLLLCLDHTALRSIQRRRYFGCSILRHLRACTQQMPAGLPAIDACASRPLTTPPRTL